MLVIADLEGLYRVESAGMGCAPSTVSSLPHRSIAGLREVLTDG